MKSRSTENKCQKWLNTGSYRIFSIFFLFSFLLVSNNSIGQESIFDQKVKVVERKSTVYEVLNQISDQIGYFFIYDSKLVNSDRTVKVSNESKSLNELLKELVDDSSLQFKVIDKHILIYKEDSNKIASQKSHSSNRVDTLKYLTVKGKVVDKQSKKPLTFVTVGILEENIGTITNLDGYFSFKLPASFVNSNIVISHLGYKTQRIPIKILIDQKIDIFMETEFISIQEVIIRNIDSKELIRKVFQNRQQNYNRKPVYLTCFYREGVLKDSKYLNYSEAILKIFKTSYIKNFDSDQIKLLKSRKVVNVDQKDTVVLKLKGGLHSCLALDIIKNVPDFMDPETFDSYNFTKVDIVSINSRNAYAIAFEQKEFVTEPLYKGTLYVDMDSYALISSNFEINPKFVKNTDYLFILKKSRKLRVTPERISYSVTYNYLHGRYYINHIRGDLTINYKKRYHVFSNNFNAFLELATSQIDTLNVQKFERGEVLKTNTVFLDTKFAFDETYWGDYNIIVPEEKLSQAFSRINAKMEFEKPDQP